MTSTVSYSTYTVTPVYCEHLWSPQKTVALQYLQVYVLAVVMLYGVYICCATLHHVGNHIAMATNFYKHVY